LDFQNADFTRNLDFHLRKRFAFFPPFVCPRFYHNCAMTENHRIMPAQNIRQGEIFRKKLKKIFAE